MPLSLTPISVKDSANTPKPLVAYNDGTNSAFANVLLDNGGALISPATADNQATANTALASIAAKIPAKGLAAAAASTPVVIASDQAAVPVAMTANTSGGASTFCANGASGSPLLTNTLTAVKTSAGNLYGFDFVNTGNASAFVQLFDAAAGSVTLGTTPAKMAKWVPAGGSWEEKFGGEGKIAFGTAITMAATTTASGNTAPGTGILANVTFK
jgi:hypothetical protein